MRNNCYYKGACLYRYSSHFFSNKEWAKIEMKKQITRLSTFTIRGQSAMGNYQDMMALYHVSLAELELCFLEIPFLYCTELWLYTKEISLRFGK